MSLPWKILAIAGVVALSFFYGWSNGRAEVDILKATYAEQIAEAKLTAQVKQDTAQANYRAQANADADTLASLKQQLQDLNAYLDASPTGSNACLSGADTERLRGLW